MSDEIPLETQRALFEQRFARVVTDLQRDLTQTAYLSFIHDLCLKRLDEGHPLYGDDMYRWGSPCRQRNMDEELADYIVYGTSEP